ncbi:MAG: hypothetical protein Kow00124_04310 [Anaerolineae bacterium]
MARSTQNAAEPLRLDHLTAGAGPHHRRTGRPLVTLTYAQSLDGSIARRRGEPLALSGPESLRMTHRLRATHDAILVGIGTVLADNPSLTVRHVPGPSPQPVILDSHLRFPLSAKMMGNPRPPWIATTPAASQERADALRRAGARVLPLPARGDGRVDLNALLQQLGRDGIKSLMVEGGAGVIASFLASGLADLCVLTLAPVFVGGLHAAADLGIGPMMADLPRLTDVQTCMLEADVIVWGRFVREVG